MKKEKIKEVLNLMIDSIDKKKIELYNKLIDDECFGKIGDYEEFYLGLIFPHEQFISGLIKCEISNNEDVEFILQNSQFIESHFEHWIKSIEGYGCCADKSRTILRRLIEFYKNGTEIEFDYTAEYTFHLPKIIFKTHMNIIEFYEGLKHLYYGNPSKYLSSINSIIAIQKPAI